MASILSLELPKEQSLLEAATRVDALRLMHSYLSHEVQVLVQDQQRRIFSYEAVPIQEIPGWESVRDGILRFRPDIILTHLNWQQIAIEQARQLHIPVIHMSRICDANPAADWVVFNSNYVADAWCRRFPLCLPNRRGGGPGAHGRGFDRRRFFLDDALAPAPRRSIVLRARPHRPRTTFYVGRASQPVQN